MQGQRIEVGQAVLQAVALQQAGQFGNAEQVCRAILRARPGEPTALHVLGACLLQRGEYAEAERALAATLKGQPQQAAALANRGIALRALKRHAEALVCFSKALKFEPDNGRYYWHRASVLTDLGRDHAALKDFDQALHRLGRFNALLTDWLATAERAASKSPEDRDALAARAYALVELKQWHAALGAYQELLRHEPQNNEACAGMAGVLLRLNRPDEALVASERVLATDPVQIMALNNKAMALADLGRYSEAVDSLDALIALDPGNATVQWNRGLHQLVQGHFTDGWRGFEWRWQRSAFLKSLEALPEPLWDGRQQLAGKTILLHAEQGFGDTIQFARFAPLLAEGGARVIIGAHRPLKPLLQTIAGVSAVIASGDEMPAFDLHCPLMSLPARLGTTLETIPAAVPYVRVDPVRQAAWAARLGPRLQARVGLTWTGNPQQDDDLRRSMRLRLLAPLLSAPVQFFCLNKSVRDEDRDDLQRFGIRHYEKELTDFAETAALASLMDLVISTDTSIAHLAGALAKPLWILLADRADFRWLLAREDCPWYPTARLFRQHARGDWEGVIRRVAVELNVLAATAGAAPANAVDLG